MEIIKKVWGEERIYFNSDKYCLKELILDPGFICSYHKHNIKDECFLIQDNSNPVYMRLEGEHFILEPGDFIHIPPGYFHEFAQLGKFGHGLFYEISSHDSPEDSYRESSSREVSKGILNSWRMLSRFNQLRGTKFNAEGTPLFEKRGD